MLGIDVSLSTVAVTTGRGGRALCRSVFDTLPAEGQWGTALLLDGNIGIGSDPVRLLQRGKILVRERGAVWGKIPVTMWTAATWPACMTAAPSCAGSSPGQLWAGPP